MALSVTADSALEGSHAAGNTAVDVTLLAGARAAGQGESQYRPASAF